MGGGGVMRSAAKVAGIGVSAARLRGAPPPAPLAEQSLFKASQPASSAALSSQEVKAATAEVTAPWHTAPSLDDWEFADHYELIMRDEEPMPRVVFDAVPNFQEAKDATLDLKEAIDNIFLSSCSSNTIKNSPDDFEVPVPSLHSELETKTSATELVPTPEVPKHALHALKYLSGSTEAQNVVASIVSDANVWNAIMQNPTLQNFVQSEKTASGVEVEKSSIKLEELPDSEETRSPRNRFMDAMQNIKLKIAEMVGSISNYFQTIFGFLDPEKTGSDGDGKPRPIFTDARTFMGLAVLVVMVILVKRH